MLGWNSHPMTWRIPGSMFVLLNSDICLCLLKCIRFGENGSRLRCYWRIHRYYYIHIGLTWRTSFAQPTVVSRELMIQYKHAPSASAYVKECMSQPFFENLNIIVLLDERKHQFSRLNDRADAFIRSTICHPWIQQMTCCRTPIAGRQLNWMLIFVVLHTRIWRH